MITTQNDLRPIELHRWCGRCDCRTLQRACLDFIGLPCWKCLNCLAEVRREIRKSNSRMDKAFLELTIEAGEAL